MEWMHFGSFLFSVFPRQTMTLPLLFYMFNPLCHLGHSPMRPPKYRVREGKCQGVRSEHTLLFDEKEGLRIQFTQSVCVCV